MELFASQNPRSYSLYSDLNILFRARKVTGTFEKRAPGDMLLMPPFHDTRFWYHALIDQMSSC